jgi:hypothetical protein
MHMCAKRSGFSFSKCRTVIVRRSVKSLRTNEFPYCRLFKITTVRGSGAAWQSSKNRTRTESAPGKYEMEAIAPPCFACSDGATSAAAAGRIGYYPALRCSRSTNAGARNRLLIEAPN